jgi:hypothetical protein
MFGRWATAFWIQGCPTTLSNFFRAVFRLPSVYLDPTRMRLFRALLMPVCALYTPRTRSDAMPYVRFSQTLPASPRLMEAVYTGYLHGSGA